MELIDTKCLSCGTTFQREKKRGRPPSKCESCRVVQEPKPQVAKVPGVRPPQFGQAPKLWTGKDVVPTRQDLPKGREAQCPKCNRLFSSDTCCELHKSYRMPKTTHCKPPASLGLTAIERRGLPIWTLLSSEEELSEEVDLTLEEEVS